MITSSQRGAGASIIKRLLIIDDNILLTRCLRHSLFDFDLHVDIAVTGNEALKYVKDKVYNIIILDQVLPDISGKALLIDIKKYQNKANVITTGQKSDTGNLCLIKPFSTQDFKTIIKDTLEKI